MRNPLASLLLLFLLLSAAAGSAAVWLHSRNSRLTVRECKAACSRKPTAVLPHKSPHRPIADLRLADILWDCPHSATAATTDVQRSIPQSPQTPHSLTPPCVSPGFPSGAVGAADAVPSVASAGSQAQEEANAALDSGVAGGNYLSLRPLLSRQLLVWGSEQQKLLPASRVLLIGAGGAAVEAAKCLLQSGVGCILLADPEEPAPQERAANFALAEHAEQQEVVTSAAGAVAVPSAVQSASEVGVVSDPSSYPLGYRVAFSAQQLEAEEQQHQSAVPRSRAEIACAALRRVGAPYARVSEVSLHIQPGETAAAWRGRVKNLLQQVDVILLCDRPLQQKLFFSAVARELWSQGREQQVRELQQQQWQPQEERQLHRRRCGPLVVTVCTAGLAGRVAVDFGDFTFSRISEEAALTALLQKHAQPQNQQKQHRQRQQQQEQIGRLHFAPLCTTLSLPETKQAFDGQQSLTVQDPPHPQQQYLIAAFEALDAAETDGRGASEDRQQAARSETDRYATGTAADAPVDNSKASDRAPLGSLRSWSANRLPAASLVAARAAAIWKRRYGLGAASAAAEAAAAAARASRKSAAAVTAAAEVAAATAVSIGEAEAARIGALMARGSRGHLAPVAAAMGALAAQETLKGLTRKYRPLQGPFVLHALDLLALTAQDHREGEAASGVIGGKDGCISNTRSCNGYATVPVGASAKGRTLPAAAVEPEAESVAAAKTATRGAACFVCDVSRGAAARRVPWEGQQQLLGLELQRRLNHLRVLLVGTGAIGCEVLKNFALMGVSSDCRNSSSRKGITSSRYCCNSSSSRGPSKSNKQRDSGLMRLLTRCIHRIRSSMLRQVGSGVTGIATSAAAATREACAVVCQRGLLSLMDGDTVETSNLSRQVLFTASSLHQPKAAAAAAAVLRFCSRTRLCPFSFMLSPETLRHLPAMYIQEQDLIVAALDSVDARLYVDALCLLHTKPWVEAGTLGLRGHSQSLVPYITEHYAAAVRGTASNASRAVQSLKAVPVCSIRGTPTAPLHAVHWASAQLQQTFKTDISAAHMLLRQLLQKELQSPQRIFAERQEHRSATVSPPAPPHAAPDDVHGALGILGMAPVAVSAAAAGPMRLQLLLRLALEVLRVRRSTIKMFESGASQKRNEESQYWREYYEKCGGSNGGVAPMSTVHLRLLSFAMFLFSALYEVKTVKKQIRGEPEAEASTPSNIQNAVNHRNRKALILDPTDADTVDFVAATGQLLAASLGMEQPAKAARELDSLDPRSAYIFQQEQAEELLLQGKGLGPWSRQCVAEAVQSLLSEAAVSEAAKMTVVRTCADPTLSVSALAEELVREVAATAAAAGTGADLNFLKAPIVPSLSADGAVPLRFLTSAARLRCRAFGLTPLPGPEETQQLIGSIVPATATATTLAAALACIEVYRLVALNLAGRRLGQCMENQEQQLQQQPKHTEQQTERVSPVLWLDKGERRYRRAATKQQQQFLRSSFFSLSVPFLAEAPPLPPSTHRFHDGRWRGQHFSPWHFFRLQLHGGGFNTIANQDAGQGVVPGEAEAAERITISKLVELIEKDTRVRVLSLSCEGTLLYTAPPERDMQQKQLEAVLPPRVAELFDDQQSPRLPDPGTSLTEAIRLAALAPIHSKTQQCCQPQTSAGREKQQEKGPTWAVILIAASDPLGADVPLPALKVLLWPRA